MGMTIGLISLVDLRAATHQFFKRHWCLDNAPPDWDGIWYFKNTIPNQEKPGCYALLAEDNIVYIGVGAGQAPGDYQQAGLGKRLHEYWRVDDSYSGLPTNERRYKPSDGWDKLTGIITIGFDKDYGYMARALEAFLIAKLNPPENKNLKKS